MSRRLSSHAALALGPYILYLGTLRKVYSATKSPTLYSELHRLHSRLEVPQAAPLDYPAALELLTACQFFNYKTQTELSRTAMVITERLLPTLNPKQLLEVLEVAPAESALQMMCLRRLAPFETLDIRQLNRVLRTMKRFWPPAPSEYKLWQAIGSAFEKRMSAGEEVPISSFQILSRAIRRRAINNSTLRLSLENAMVTSLERLPSKWVRVVKELTQPDCIVKAVDIMTQRLLSALDGKEGHIGAGEQQSLMASPSEDKGALQGSAPKDDAASHDAGSEERAGNQAEGEHRHNEECKDAKNDESVTNSSLGTAITGGSVAEAHIRQQLDEAVAFHDAAESGQLATLSVKQLCSVLQETSYISPSDKTTQDIVQQAVEGFLDGFPSKLKTVPLRKLAELVKVVVVEDPPGALLPARRAEMMKMALQTMLDRQEEWTIEPVMTFFDLLDSTFATGEEAVNFSEKAMEYVQTNINSFGLSQCVQFLMKIVRLKQERCMNHPAVATASNKLVDITVDLMKNELPTVGNTKMMLQRVMSLLSRFAVGRTALIRLLPLLDISSSSTFDQLVGVADMVERLRMDPSNTARYMTAIVDNLAASEHNVRMFAIPAKAAKLLQVAARVRFKDDRLLKLYAEFLNRFGKDLPAPQLASIMSSLAQLGYPDSRLFVRCGEQLMSRSGNMHISILASVLSAYTQAGVMSTKTIEACLPKARVLVSSAAAQEVSMVLSALAKLPYSKGKNDALVRAYCMRAIQLLPTFTDAQMAAVLQAVRALKATPEQVYQACAARLAEDLAQCLFPYYVHCLYVIATQHPSSITFGHIEQLLRRCLTPEDGGQRIDGVTGPMVLSALSAVWGKLLSDEDKSVPRVVEIIQRQAAAHMNATGVCDSVVALTTMQFPKEALAPFTERAKEKHVASRILTDTKLRGVAKRAGFIGELVTGPKKAMKWEDKATTGNGGGGERQEGSGVVESTGGCTHVDAAVARGDSSAAKTVSSTLGDVLSHEERLQAKIRPVTFPAVQPDPESVPVSAVESESVPK